MVEQHYFREDLLRTRRAIVFAARIPMDPQKWTERERGFMNGIAAFLATFGYGLHDIGVIA